MIKGAAPGTDRITPSAGRGYDTKDFVFELRFLNGTHPVGAKRYPSP